MRIKRVTILTVFKERKEYLIKILLLTYIFSYIGATYNHTMDLLKYGLFPYQNVSIILNIYWTMLTLLDFLAIVVLFFHIDLGLIFYGLIIISDVIVNYSFMILTKGIWSWINFGQISQMLFLVIYLSTFHYIFVWY